jgi:16S rRNA C1402 (ribose-2'-O) methylase RsmI
MVFVLRNLQRSQDGLPSYHLEIPEFLSEAVEVLGGNRKAVLCYNLTKPNEKVIRGTMLELQKYFNETPREPDLITIVIDTVNGSFSV